MVVKLHLVSEGGPVDLADPSQELLFTMRASLGTFERRRISLNTKFALDRKKQLGERISGQAPYGYKFINGKVVVDNNEQQIIKRIHQLHNEGLSLRKLIIKLTSEHIRNREGNSFTRPAITKILAKEILWN